VVGRGRGTISYLIILSFNNTYCAAITMLGTRNTRNICSLKEMSKVDLELRLQTSYRRI